METRKIRAWHSFALFLPAISLAGCLGTAADPQEFGEPVCESKFSITGTKGPTDVAVPETLEGGCWPFGLWTLNLGPAIEDECGDAELPAEFLYQVDADELYEPIITYMGTLELPPDPGIKQGGGSECQGTFEHFLNNSTEVLRIKAFESMGAITGDATFERWSAPQL